jgi:ABC-type antimicrobial peptide transport system permease subunit
VDGERAAIISEALARQMFPKGDAIGRLIFGQGNGSYRVIGVSADVRQPMVASSQSTPQVYLPVSQAYASESKPLGMTIAVRTDGPPAGYATGIRAAVAEMAPGVAIFDVKSMETHLNNALLLPRLAGFLFGSCGAAALAIAAIGIYGVASFGAARRTRELGIRMALGALRPGILWIVVRPALALTVAGSALGLVLAAGIARFASSLLFGIQPTDAVTLVGAPVFLIAVAAVSAGIPALRAARRSPAATLRHD